MWASHIHVHCMQTLISLLFSSLLISCTCTPKKMTSYMKLTFMNASAQTHIILHIAIVCGVFLCDLSHGVGHESVSMSTVGISTEQPSAQTHIILYICIYIIYIHTILLLRMRNRRICTVLAQCIHTLSLKLVFQKWEDDDDDDVTFTFAISNTTTTSITKKNNRTNNIINVCLTAASCTS